MGRQWRHNLEYRLWVTLDNNVELLRPDGSVKVFQGLMAPVDEKGQLTTTVDAQGTQTGWKYDTRVGQAELYDLRGRIIRIDFKSGGFLTYAYPNASSDIASSITDHFNRTLTFGYDTSARLISVTTPAGALYQYTGGPTFVNTPYLYPVQPGQMNVVALKLTGYRKKDFDIADAIAGTGNRTKDWVWHHVDDFDPETGYATMELIHVDAHKATFPHRGGAAQWSDLHGRKYDGKK